MTDAQFELLSKAKKIIIIQAENPDGDSLGSSIGLESILSHMGKEVTMYCPVQIPRYLRFIEGWDRVVDEYDAHADLAIIVDTVSDTLLSKVLDIPHARHHLETHPVLVMDHHETVESSLPFQHELIIGVTAVATGELIFDIVRERKLHVDATGAAALYTSIMSDSLGLTTQTTTAASIHTIADLVDLGVVPSTLEAKRREFMKKSPEILEYKGQLIGRISYHCDGKLALVHIPWEDIQAYSDQYNPSMLVLDEMRLVEGVEVGVAIKTYPDGKITGKIRANLPIAETIAGYFGGGGHQYAAGFRAYDTLEAITTELLKATDKALAGVNHD
jgi:phosphoesterase RecJ-like protein